MPSNPERVVFLFHPFRVGGHTDAHFYNQALLRSFHAFALYQCWYVGIIPIRIHSLYSLVLIKILMDIVFVICWRINCIFD